MSITITNYTKHVHIDDTLSGRIILKKPFKITEYGTTYFVLQDELFAEKYIKIADLTGFTYVDNDDLFSQIDLINGTEGTVTIDTTGLATSGKQDTGNTSLGNLDTNLGAKADSVASTDTGTFSLIALFKRLLQGITTLVSNVYVTFKDGPQLDAFHNLRTSTDGNRFDGEMIYDFDEENFDKVLTGAGTLTYNSNARDVTIGNGGTGLTDSASIFSHYDIPYTAGNSQNITLTGVLNLANIGSGTPYIFIRTKVSGTVTTTKTDISGVAALSGINWSYSHIFNIDFQSLKVGRIRYNMSRNGLPVAIGEIVNDNLRSTGYWQMPTLPVMYRIWNDADYTYMEIGYGDENNAVGFMYRIAKNSTATMKFICCTVKSEGGKEIHEIEGKNRAADSGITAKSVTATPIPMLSIRPRTTYRGQTNRTLHVPMGYNFYGDNPCRVRVLYKPTLTNPVWIPCGNPVTAGSFDVGEWYVIVSVGTTDFTLIGAASNTVGVSFKCTGAGTGTGTAVDEHSSMEYDISATAVSGGAIIDAEHFATNKNIPNASAGILGKAILSLGRTGTSDILTIKAVRVTTTSSNSFASITWKEIR